MSIAQLPGTLGPGVSSLQWPRQIDLARQTLTTAARESKRVADVYLQFRRDYYHDDNPSISTIPPVHTAIRQAQLAQLAERTLQFIPGAVKAVPLLGGMVEHLQLVADIHSMSEHERTALHNTTMFFLHGIDQGIQPWYVDWLLANAENLSANLSPSYFMQNPWDALYYQNPIELTVFEAAIRDGNIQGVERVIERMGDRLTEALGDPIGIQPRLAFTGPDSEARETNFHLLTTAALALGGFLIVGETRALLQHRRGEDLSITRLAPLPPEMSALITK